MIAFTASRAMSAITTSPTGFSEAPSMRARLLTARSARRQATTSSVR